MSARVRRSGLARTQIGPPWSNPGHAPRRRAIPLISGDGKNWKTGEPPRPSKQTGASEVLFSLSAVVPAERSESRDPVNTAWELHGCAQRLLVARCPFPRKRGSRGGDN